MCVLVHSLAHNFVSCHQIDHQLSGRIQPSATFFPMYYTQSFDKVHINLQNKPNCLPSYKAKKKKLFTVTVVSALAHAPREAEKTCASANRALT